MPNIFNLSPLRALRARIPALAPAEKSALAILLALLACGAALRAWDDSGVSLGPVNDFETLRALVTQARAADATAWPCALPEAEAWAGAHDKKGKKDKAGKGKKKEDGGKKAPAAILDLNTASERQLNSLPGVGPSTAKAIVAWRATNGTFGAPEELLNVKGIGPKKFEALRPWIKVSGQRKPAPAETTGIPAAQARNPRGDTLLQDPKPPP